MANCYCGLCHVKYNCKMLICVSFWSALHMSRLIIEALEPDPSILRSRSLTTGCYAHVLYLKGLSHASNIKSAVIHS